MKIECKNKECQSYRKSAHDNNCLAVTRLCMEEAIRQLISLQQQLQEKKEALKEIAECCSGRERMKQIAWEAIKE